MGLRGVARAWVLVVAGGSACGQGTVAQPGVVETHPGFARVGHPDAGQAGKETVITPAQAKELFASVDTIMAFVSKDTGLPAVAKVKCKLLTRAEVNAVLTKQFDEDESAKRMQASEIVLKKFGLLQPDFNLRPFMLSLLTEQIAGFYDDKTKVMNLLNWLKPEEQKPVLAHELTHAVQDQKVGLEKWSSNGFKGVSKTAAEDAERVPVDELETARQAVTEGQAMVVFVDWGLPKGQTLADVPEIGQSMKDAAGDSSGSPVMARAPLLLQRSLTFPYTDGLGFEQALLIYGGKGGGKALAFAGALAKPPSSSFEVMTPAAYLAHAPVPLLRLPNVHPLLDAEYEPYDLGVMGELDVEMMASLFGGPEMGRALAPAWDGGVYYAAQRRSASAAEKKTTASLGLMYLSRWKSEEAADAFERMYVSEIGRQYSGVKERTADEAEGEKIYTTSEGDVLMTLTGKDFWVSEGFPVGLGRKLRDETMAVQGVGPMKMAAGPELTLGVSVAMARLGMVKAGLGVLGR